MTLDFAFGFDTSGLRAFADSGYSDFAAIADGFYVKDLDAEGKDVDEVTLKAALIGRGGIDVLVVQGGIKAGIDAVIGLNLDDPNNDGRLRFDELAAKALLGPLAFFDVGGQLDVFVGPFLRFGITIPFYGFKTLHEVDLPEFRETLIDFNFDAGTVGQPTLASLNQGVLTLNMGPLAGNRQEGDTTDGDEVFTVLPGAIPSQVIVEAFGVRQQYDGVTRIVGDSRTGERHDHDCCGSVSAGGDKWRRRR